MCGFLRRLWFGVCKVELVKERRRGANKPSNQRFPQAKEGDWSAGGGISKERERLNEPARYAPMEGFYSAEPLNHPLGNDC